MGLTLVGSKGNLTFQVTHTSQGKPKLDSYVTKYKELT
jgi:hypothetical protein